MKKNINAPVTIASASRIFGSFFVFLFNILISRMLGASDSGVFFSSMAIVTIVTIFSRLGLDQAALKYVSNYWSKNDEDKISNYMISSISIILLSSFLLTIVMQSAILFIDYKNNIDGTVLKILSLVIIPLSIISFLCQCIKAMDKLAIGTMLQNGAIPFISMVSISIIYLVTNIELNLNTTSWIYVLSSLFVTILLIIYASNYFSFKKNIFVSSIIETLKYLKISIPMMTISACIACLSYADLIIVLIFTDNYHAGIYNAAARTASIFTLLVIAANGALSPGFAVARVKGDKQKSRQLLISGIFTTSLFAFPLAILFLCFPKYIMSLFGDDFIAGYKLLFILTIGQIINVITGPVSHLLMMSDKQNSVQKVLMLSVLFSIIANLILVKTHGAIGVAWGTAITIIIYNSILSLRAWRFLKN